MKRKKTRKINGYHDLKLVKEQIRVEIVKNEYSIRDSHKNILTSLTPVNIFNSLIETVISRPNIAVKTGFVIASLLKSRSGKNKDQKLKS